MVVRQNTGGLPDQNRRTLIGSTLPRQGRRKDDAYGRQRKKQRQPKRRRGPLKGKTVSPAVSLIVAYQFIRMLATAPEDTEAYRLGLIDDNAKRIKKPTTALEKRAYGPLNRIVFNLQRLLSKVPGGKARIANYAAALWLLRECEAHGEDNLGYYTDTELLDAIREVRDEMFEDAPVNAVGGGAVAGVGVGPDGEPGVPRGRRRRRRRDPRLNAIMRRKFPNA